MSGKDQDAGLMSNAGLVRYFDEDSGTTINPKTLVAFAVFMGVVVVMLNVIF